MVVQHPRAQLVAALTPLLPSTWRIIPAQRDIDPANKTTVVVKQSQITKTPEAPAGARNVGFVLTLVSRYTAPERAEDDLDGTLPELLKVLDQIRNLRWTTATKVSVQDEKYLGYDVEVSITTKKESL